MKKNRLLLLLCLLLAALLSACAASTGPIEISGYIRPAFYGSEGNGTVILDFDYAQFEQDMAKNRRITDSAVLSQLENAFTLTAAPADNLSNGDAVAITASFDQKAFAAAGCAMTCHELSALVQGLDDTNYLDPFDNIVVNFDGASPNVTMNIEVQSTDGVYGFLSYVPDCNTSLAIGDKVTVTVKYDPATVSRMGVTLSGNTMEYTVPDYLASYPTTWETFTDSMKEDMASDIKLQISSLRYRADPVKIYSGGAAVATTLDLTCSDYAYTRAYFASLKDGVDYDADTMDFCNALIVEYCFNAHSEGDTAAEGSVVYGGFMIPDLSVGSSDYVMQSADFLFTGADLDENAWYAREVSPLTKNYNLTPVVFEADAVG